MVLALEDYNAESVQTFDRAAARYAQKYFDLREYDPYYARFVAALPPTPCAVLDLACGPGNVSAFVRAQRPDVQLHGADRSPSMLAQLQKRVPGVTPWCVDARDLSALPAPLDGAAFFFGLSYFDDADAARVLSGLHRLLRAQAPLLLATVAGDPAGSGVHTGASGDRVHSFLRTRSGIEALVRAAGFAVDWVGEYASPAQASVQSQDVVLLARRAGPTPPAPA